MAEVEGGACRAACTVACRSLRKAPLWGGASTAGSLSVLRGVVWFQGGNRTTSGKRHIRRLHRGVS